MSGSLPVLRTTLGALCRFGVCARPLGSTALSCARPLKYSKLAGPQQQPVQFTAIPARGCSARPLCSAALIHALRSVPLARTLSARPPLLGPFRLGHPRDRNHRVGPFGSDPSGSASLAWSLDSVVRCGPLGSVPSPRSLDSIVSLGPLGSVSSGPAPSDRPSPPRIGSPCDLVLGRAGPRHLAALAAPGLASVVGHFGRRSRRSSVAQVLGRVDRRSRWSSVASILCCTRPWL